MPNKPPLLMSPLIMGPLFEGLFSDVMIFSEGSFSPMVASGDPALLALAPNTIPTTTATGSDVGTLSYTTGAARPTIPSTASIPSNAAVGDIVLTLEA